MKKEERSSALPVLCVTWSPSSVGAVSRSVEMLRCPSIRGVVTQQTERGARRTISSRSFAAVVVVAGDDSDMSSSQEFVDMGNRILKLVRKRYPSVLRIMYSIKAWESQRGRHKCIEWGADAVVSTQMQLYEALYALVNPAALPDSKRQCTNSYAPLKPRHDREEQLVALAGGEETMRVEQIWKMTTQLERQLTSIPPEFVSHTRERCKNSVSMGNRIRVVHVSDTHALHRHVPVPPGDIFAHTGNITDYTSKQADLLSQLKDFLYWLEVGVCPLFEKVIFIAGNHDVLLDPVNCRDPVLYNEAMEVLKRFLASHPTVAYLENSSIRYRGLTIFGSSTTFCADKPEKKRAHCNAFERSFGDFVQASDCKKIDILLTHRPPPSLSAQGDSYDLFNYKQDDSRHKSVSLPVLSLGLQRSKKSSLQPRLHLSGHFSKDFGLSHASTKHGDTLYMNGSQKEILRQDRYGGGTPLVVDLPYSG